ncbi:MAG TPA: uroporphyrinogen-III C-methyltransferase, partial [Phenylobacterium sp.]|nr:uroporphyrinogen-III C-methyltransferase [Phenylobacterium sp.]
DEINRMLVAFALDGLNVVRLKGGDPFIFGRGGEELEACREAGVDCHVVPGVTAALAAGASAGAPLTHRGSAQAVTFVTGHAAQKGRGGGGEPDLDWESLAKANQTVVVYMGLSMAAPIAARLMAAGRAGSTPALIVENASRADERRVVTTLSGLAEAAANLNGPALLIVGEAMALAEASNLPREAAGGGAERAAEGASDHSGGMNIRKQALGMGFAPSTIGSTADGPPPAASRGR